jgi:purine catabolism regulator
MGNVANDGATMGNLLSDNPSVRVSDVLALPAFADVTVVAGHEGLDRVVERANVMEVPDIAAWVKPQELLLTTGYPLRDTPGGMASLVTTLDSLGVSAIGVKLRRYLDELPQDMLRAADVAGLPLLLLPDGAGFDDLLNSVVAEILQRQSTVLVRGDTVDQRLVSVVLHGGGLDELVSALHDSIGGTTLVTTTDGRVLAGAGAGELPDARSRPELFVESGRFRSERFAPGLHALSDGSMAVIAVMAGRTDHGRLVVLKDGESLGPGDLHVLERAAIVLALAITKSMAVQAVEAKYRGDFVREVLLDRAGSTDAVVDHFASLGWDVDRRLVVVVAGLDSLGHADEVRTDARTAQDRFANAWANVVSRHDRTAPVVGFAQEVVALVGIPDGAEARPIVDQLVHGVAGDGGGGRRSFATGVSRLIESPTAIAAGYEQARRSVHVGRQLQGTGAIAHFDDLGAFRLLSLIEDVNELRNFVTEVLGDLAHETDPEAADMRATLRVLLDTNFNVAETSRRLHFHYNTLRYRISKLEKMVGPFIADPDLQLDLALALRVMQMRKDG